MAHNGAKVRNFAVTRWLNEGDLIYLDDSEKSKENSLEVIFTPGHTPDSIALYAHWEKRLFVGDTLYPYTVIHLDCLGSSVSDFKASIQKLIQFVGQVSPSKQSNVQQPTVVINQPVPLTDSQKRAIDDFCNMLGLSKGALNFDIEGMMKVCDWLLEESVSFYLSMNDSIATMFPKVQKSEGALAKIDSSSSEVRISCGHVEANLGVEALQQVLNMIEFIQIGGLSPSFVDGEYGEYTSESFSLILPLKSVKQM